MSPLSPCEVKCELCSGEFEDIDRCKVCDTKYCKDCGDQERSLCNDCIDFDTASDGDMGDLSGD